EFSDTGIDLQLVAKVYLDAELLDIAGQMPANLQAIHDLREGVDTSVWMQSLLRNGLRAGWRGVGPDASAWRGQLRAEGAGGEGSVEGELGNGVLRVVIAPSQLALVDDRLMLRPLNLELPQGALRVTGQVQYGEEAPAFDLQLASDAL